MESHLCEYFAEQNNYSFDKHSIILVNDLGQFSPVMKKPLYVGEILGKCSWVEFTIVIILESVFHQKGINATQLHPHAIDTAYGSY